MKKIYTIGHSNFDLLNIIVKLKKYDIDWVFDVRSVPFSRYASQFNANNLEKELPKHGISYFKMGKFFGARQILPKHRPCYPNGYLDFELWCRTDEYRLAKKGMLERGLLKHNIALLCTEKDPIDCHRTVMITRDLELDNVETFHILEDGGLKSQADLSAELLTLYLKKNLERRTKRNLSELVEGQGEFNFNNPEELHFYSDDREVNSRNEDVSNESDVLREVYQKLNEKIAFRIF